MPFDVITKDGITLKGVPDGTPREAIQAKIDAHRAKTAPAREWANVPAEALGNLPSSLGNLAVNMAQPIIHPIDTAKAIGSLGAGAYKNVAGGYSADDPDVAAADAVGAMFKQNYGSMEGFKNYVATDPAAALSDLASVLSGGAGLVAKAGGPAGKIATTVGKIASAIDPAANVIRAAKLPIKAAGWGARRGADIVNTLTDTGVPIITNRILADRLNKTGLGDIPGTADQMRGNASPVPGFNRTASQAATGASGQTVIESSERQTSRISGGPSALMNARLAEQSDALNAAMAKHAKTPEILKKALGVRAARADRLYTAARESTARVVPDSVAGMARKILSDNSKEVAVTTPVKRVLSNISVKPGGTLSMKEAMSAMKDIKNMLESPHGSPEASYNRKVLVDLHKELEESITDASATYRAANRAHRIMSGPINKMQIAQEIKARMTNAKDADSFQAALADFADEEKFINKVTGDVAGKSFADIFTPKELNEIYAVRDEMQNAFTAKSPRQRTGIDGLKSEIPLEEGLGLNLLSRPVAMANWLAKRLGRDIEPKVAAELIRLHLNPEQMVKALESGAAPRATDRISQGLDRILPVAAGPVLFQTGRATNPLVIDVKNRK